MTPAPLVSFDHVDVELAGVTVLRDLCWHLPRGEHWGVVGANGSGKTSFLRLLGGNLWPAPDSGRRRYDFGRGLQSDAVQAQSEIVIVGHELQDRYARLNWNFSGLDVVLSGVYRTDVPRRRPQAAERTQGLAVLRRLGIAYLAARPFLEMSRGEQRRVLIARGVAFAPSVLLLDEPASGLDTQARAELWALLERAATELTLVCTAHVADDLPALIRHVLHLAHGSVVAAGPRELTRGAPPPARPLRDEGTQVSHAASGGTAAAPLIELTHADVWLGTRRVLQNLSWRLADLEQWLVTGPNGSGKSSFLRLLHGQLRPALGSEIRWPALNNPRNVWALRRQVAWLSPELQAAYRYPTTVRACVASGFESSVGLTRALTTGETSRVEELLAQFDLLPLADRQLTSLSYGQVRRALIARALANRPRVLLLDEPWEGLDAAVAEQLSTTLDSVIAGGTQLVCASHLAAHRRHFTHELALDGGRVLRAGAIDLK